jgi:hypothetical protein
MHHTMQLRPGVGKQPYLELKTRPKQLLGSLPLVITLSAFVYTLTRFKLDFKNQIKKKELKIFVGGQNFQWFRFTADFRLSSELMLGIRFTRMTTKMLNSSGLQWSRFDQQSESFNANSYPAQPSPAQPSPAQPSPAQPSPAQPSPAQAIPFS